jgi:hypothetical protein
MSTFFYRSSVLPVLFSLILQTTMPVQAAVLLAAAPEGPRNAPDLFTVEALSPRPLVPERAPSHDTVTRVVELLNLLRFILKNFGNREFSEKAFMRNHLATFNKSAMEAERELRRLLNEGFVGNAYSGGSRFYLSEKAWKVIDARWPEVRQRLQNAHAAKPVKWMGDPALDYSAYIFTKPVFMKRTSLDLDSFISLRNPTHDLYVALRIRPDELPALARSGVEIGVSGVFPESIPLSESAETACIDAMHREDGSPRSRFVLALLQINRRRVEMLENTDDKGSIKTIRPIPGRALLKIFLLRTKDKAIVPSSLDPRKARATTLPLPQETVRELARKRARSKFPQYSS